MKLRIPPFLPAHAILVVAVAYAAGSLWLGLARLDAIASIADSGALSAATVQDLEGVLIAVADIETAARGYALTGDESYLAPFERGRRRVAPLLAGLRDRMRDDPEELATMEKLVPLIAERTQISAAGIERKRAAPERPFATPFGTRGRDSSEEIRTIVMGLVTRERSQLAQDRVALERTLNEAHRDMYLMSGLTLLLVLLLYYAVRRLRAFMPLDAPLRAADALDASGATTPAAAPAIATLIGDALMRARLALAAAPAETQSAHLRSLVAALEAARDEQAIAGHADGQPALAQHVIAEALGTLAASYTRTDGLEVNATIDRHVTIERPDIAFLLYRAAEWGLEAIALRKRAGEATLALADDGGVAVLRLSALADNPDLPVRLTPREAEAAGTLRRAADAAGGQFLVTDSTTGFTLLVQVPRAAGSSDATGATHAA